MSVPDTALPYGIRDLKVKVIAPGTGVRGSAIDVPHVQTFEFTEAEEFSTLRGDDKRAAVHGNGPVVNWSISHGGLNFEAYKAMIGGSIVTDGVTPNVKSTYKKQGGDSRPYFQAEGQSISDSGGDVHGIVYRCKVTGDVSGTWEDGEFWVTELEGEGIPESELAANLDDLYDFVHNETAAAIA